MLSADNLELLLPDVAPARVERARKVVTLLRLLVDDARRAPAASVRASLERARVEFETHTRTRLLAALLELLRHHVYADVGADSFAWFGEPQGSAAAAWRVLEDYRDELAWLPDVPAPNERAAVVSARLIEGALRLGLDAEEAELWRVRARRAQAGVEAGESAFRELFERTRARADGARGASAALGGLVECLLDRGAVRAARHLLEEHAAWAGSDARIARLRAWTRLLQEDEAGARAVDATQRAWRGRLPRVLVELRERQSAWLPLLTGKAPDGVEPECVEPDGRPPRRALGALVCAVFALREAGRHELVHWDVAPGVKERADDWLRGLEGACGEAGSPEQRVVVAAKTVVVQRTAPGVLRSSIVPGQVQALALVPISDERGEVAGWLRLEFDHHLVASSRRLAAVAGAWRERVLARRREAQPDGGVAVRAAVEDELDWRAPLSDGPCAGVFRALVAEVGMKTAQRRWWGFEVVGGRARLVAEGGSALAERAVAAPRARALRRALRTCGLVGFDEQDGELSIRAAAASGVVLPLVVRGELCGLLAIESARRKDFPESLVARWCERVRAWAVDVRIARFREWHQARFGYDVSFASQTQHGGVWVEQVLAAARSRCACALVGPTSSGKQVVARWLHFERDGAAPFAFFACGSDERALWGEPPQLGGLCARARGGTLVLDDIERLSPQGQLRLFELLERASHAEGDPGLRWIATSHASLEASAAQGALRSDLCRRLERLQIRVPALAERRVEIPRLVELLTRRFADEERVAPPRYTDDALAVLWRQPWPGNVRELENLVFKVVLLHPGQDVGAEHLERIARRFRIELIQRVPSRAPEPELVRAALATTVNLRGSVNKTRAALYLGWDPDTLVSRMNELELGTEREDPSRAREHGAASSASEVTGGAGRDPTLQE